MKIISNENGKEKVYVQMNDLGYLNGTDIPLPASIYMKAFGDISTTIYSMNRFDFVEFEEAHEIKFFKNLDFIIDYNEYKNLSLSELEAKAVEIGKKRLDIANAYNNMSDDDKLKNQKMVEDHENLDYIVKNILHLYRIKENNQSLNLPVIKDEESFKFVGDDECLYEMCGSMDPTIILLYRKDGKAMTPEERIPQGFCQAGLSIAIMEKRNDDSFIGDFSLKNRLSDDKKLLIIAFEIKKYEDQTTEPELKTENSIKKLVKSIFKRKPSN